LVHTGMDCHSDRGRHLRIWFSRYGRRDLSTLGLTGCIFGCLVIVIRSIFAFQRIGPWETIFPPPSSVFRLPSSVLRPPSSVLRLPSSVFRLPSSVLRLPSSVFRLPSSVLRLPSSVLTPLYATGWQPSVLRAPPPRDHRDNSGGWASDHLPVRKPAGSP